MAAFEVLCPEGAREGDIFQVQTEQGASLEVAVPAGVQPGESFSFELPSSDAAQPMAWLEEVLETLVQARGHADRASPPILSPVPCPAADPS